MGRALWEQSGVFRDAVSACDAALRPHTGWSVAAVLRGEEADEVPPLWRVDVVQPALFTMGVALAAVWRSLGLEPAAVVGTSQGEVAAAVVVNTRTSTVVSGDKEAIEAFVARFTKQGVFCRQVEVDYASHSRHMDAV